MKAKYVNQKTNTPPMFSNPQNPISPSFNLSPDSSAAAGRKPPVPGTSGDEDSIEVVRRRRGRPPGSKNKPKPPVILTRQPDPPPMSPYILEVSSGNDVVEAIDSFRHRKGVGFCILNGSGAVVNVTFRQPSPAAPGSTVTFHGKFDVLSISATFLPPASSDPTVSDYFSVTLAGPQGQIVGGFIAGPLIAAGSLYVVAACFNNPTFHRLPIEEEARTPAASAGTSVDVDRHSPQKSTGGDSGGGHVEGQSMYGCQIGGSDSIWAPAARVPPPY